MMKTIKYLALAALMASLVGCGSGGSNDPSVPRGEPNTSAEVPSTTPSVATERSSTPSSGSSNNTGLEGSSRNPGP